MHGTAAGALEASELYPQLCDLLIDLFLIDRAVPVPCTLGMLLSEG